MKKIGKFWYNGLGERIYNPRAYFRAIEENKNSYERYNKKKSWEDIADEAEANLIAEAERKQELERHGYSSEEDYEDAYYAGESGCELGEPSVYEPDFDDEY